jgi:hypothetical protein
MAKRRNGFIQVAEQLEAGFLAPFIVGVARSAQGVVKELQEKGPAWSGEFSNSWEIATAGKVVSGTGAPGAPQRLTAPLLTVNEFKFKPEIKYYIANKAPHADVALDLTPYVRELDRNVDFPSTPVKGKVTYGKRPAGGKRGDVSGDGSNRSTATLDWYTTYVRAGGVDRAISLYMDQALRKVKL